MKKYSKAHPESRRYAEVEFEWCGHSVAKQRGAAGYTTNLWIDGWSHSGLSGAGFGADHFFTLADIGNGAEDLELTVWRWGKEPERVWSRHPVGPAVEIVGDTLYYSTVENHLRYPDVWATRVRDGQHSRRIFHEADPRYQVTVIAREGEVFIHAANALDQRLGHLRESKIEWVSAASTLLPLGRGWWACNDALINETRRVHFPQGHFLSDARWVGEEMLVVTVHRGSDHLWCWNSGEWRLLHATNMGAIQLFHESGTPTVLIRAPETPDEVWKYTGTLQRKFTYPEPLRLRGGRKYVGDVGVPVSWVSAVDRPRALLVEAYGAYGVSARRAYPVRWLPYIAAGWAIAYVSPRGGREGGDAWWDAARTALRKKTTFDDTAAAIQALQRTLRISPAATVFFGRSAGGWLAANIAQAHGELVAAVYAEVPYVDVLRTTTNPTLPLTRLEYDEFGDPASRPEEYRALQAISPVDTVPTGGPQPLLVIRTALHDMQVLPYEALKWAARLRLAGWQRVYVGIDHDGGHFAAAKSMAEQRAEDAALLESALQRAAKTSRKKLTKRHSGMGRTRRFRRRSS